MLRAVDAVDDVQHGALARSVGTDDGAHLVRAHVEAHLRERLHAAERERDLLHLQDDFADDARGPLYSRSCGGRRERLIELVNNAHAAARSCAAGTSAIRTWACIVPVRPSSNRTEVSISQRASPAYIASSRRA